MNRSDTAQVLDRIAEYDNREITSEQISEWHYDIGHLDRDVAFEAVAIHHKVSTEPITPAHVLDLAQQMAQRKRTQQPMRRAVMGAYNVTGALNDPCPRCEAPAGQPCVHPGTQNQTHTPCIVRLLGKKTAA
jgi:hypothetical protein